MNYRIAEVMAGQDLGPSGTKIVDLDIKDLISRLVVRWRPVGGSVTPAAHPADSISKIELVAGSDILFSLSGNQAHALNIIEAPTPVFTHIHFAVGGTPMIDMNLDFGRRLYDPELAFDPNKFINPQLKITWNETTWDGLCGDHEIGVHAHCFDEKAVTPVGFLMTKEVKSYAPAANAYEYTDLPTDHVLRKLILQGQKYGSPPRTTVNAIKLSEDTDKRVPIDGDTYDLEPILRQWSGEAIDRLIGQAATPSRNFYVTPGYMIHGAAVGRGQTLYFQFAAGDGGRIGIVPSTTAKNFEAILRGSFPHGCMCIPFGDQAVPDDWYDVTKVGNLKLRIKGGGGAASTDTVGVITQQLRRYA